MGAVYRDTLEAVGGTGAYAWTQTGGAMPAGLSLDLATGLISGTAEEDGEFELAVEVISGALSSSDTVTLIIERPSLALGDIINHLLAPGVVLSVDEERYLDIIGNNNGSFDIGDFRAYLQEEGLVAADILPAAVVEALEEMDRSNRGAARKEEGR